MKKCSLNKEDIKSALLQYRTTPVIGSNWSPAQLLQSRKLRTKLPIVRSELKPKTVRGYKDHLSRRELKTKSYYDKAARYRAEFNVDDSVLFKENKQWKPATILKKVGPRSYEILNHNNNIIRRNSYHLRSSNQKLQILDEDVQEVDSHPQNAKIPYRTMKGRVTSKPVKY